MLQLVIQALVVGPEFGTCRRRPLLFCCRFCCLCSCFLVRCQFPGQFLFLPIFADPRTHAHTTAPHLFQPRLHCIYIIIQENYEETFRRLAAVTGRKDPHAVVARYFECRDSTHSLRQACLGLRLGGVKEKEGLGFRVGR